MEIGSREMLDKRKIKAVLIDLDGTLVDSMPFLFSVYRNFLQMFGIKGTQEEFQELVGLTLKEVMESLRKRHHLTVGSKELFDDYQEMLYSHYTQNVELFTGARAFLKYAKELGLKLALVTSASEKLAQGFLDSEGIDTCFDLIVTDNRVKKGKPSPDIYKKALFLLEILPDEAVAIEDSPNGVASSSGAGIYTLHLVHHDHPIEGVGEALVSEVNDWFDVNDIFKAWYE